MKSAAQYGVYLECGGKTTTGYITSSSSSWKDVCSVSGSTSYSRTTSAQTKTLTAYGEGTTVSGYGGADGVLSASASISVPALDSYAVSYNANGGSGAPSSQTKYYGVSLTLSSTKPTRTGYTFQGWGTSASDTSADYAAGANYTANAATTLYAIWKANTYAITMNANGGSLGSVPSTLTKTHDTALTLPTATPTRTNHNFLGWATSEGATTAQYQPGGSFTTEAAATLYAVWELAYIPPTITNLKASRCGSDGTLDDFGTYALVTFDWETCQLIGSNKLSSVKIACNGVTTTLAPSGISGSVSQVVGAGALSVDNAYVVAVTATDTIQSGVSTASVTVPKSQFAIDFKAGGTGVAFGKPAESEGLEVDWDARFNGEVSVGGYRPMLAATDGSYWGLVNPEGSSSGYIRTTSSGLIPYATGGSGNLGTSSWPFSNIYGNNVYAKSNLYKISSTYPVYGARVLYSNTSGTTGTITLKETAANFTFIDIICSTGEGRASGMTRVYSPNGKTVEVSAGLVGGNGYHGIWFGRYAISGTSMTPSVNQMWTANLNGTESNTANSLIVIAVVGYR